MSEKEEVVLKILDYLNEIEVRATYGAVAEVLGVLPRSVGQQFLGARILADSTPLTCKKVLQSSRSQAYNP